MLPTKHGVKGLADGGCKENFTLLASLCCGSEGAIALVIRCTNPHEVAQELKSTSLNVREGLRLNLDYR
jgi:hypothetical protein